MENIYITKYKGEYYFFYRKNTNKEYKNWIIECNKMAKKMNEKNENNTFNEFLKFLRLKKETKEIISLSNFVLTMWENEEYKLIRVETKGEILTGKNIYYSLSRKFKE